MQTEFSELIEVELKYCERWGGIWLRRTGTEGVYCSDCQPEMAEFPHAKPKRRKGQSLSSATDVTRLGEEYGTCCAEGRA
jgi:Zn-finger nucleic acid-binding protein